MKPFKVLSEEVLIESPYCPIIKQIVELPGGGMAEWFINTNEAAVIIVPILRNGHILLQKNYKHGSGQIVTEFAAGMVDEGESFLEAAKRELLEETGYTSQNWEAIGSVYSNPTGSRMQYYYFLARDAEKTHEPNLEPEEQIETFTVHDFSALKKHLANPKTDTTAATLSGLLFLGENLA